MKKTIRRMIFVVIALLFTCGLCRILVPCSPEGYWSGSYLSRLCDTRGFVRFASGKAVLYSERTPPPTACRFFRLKPRLWQWNFHSVRLTGDRLDFAINTNRVILCQPGWFWMECEDRPNGTRFTLYRDLRKAVISKVMREQPAPRTIEDVGKTLLELHRKRVRESSIPESTW